MWDACIRTFLDEVWVATILCCHSLCERELAGVLSLSRACLNGQLPKNWERLGLGGLLGLIERHNLLPSDLIHDLRTLGAARKPYGHWRSAAEPDSLMQRIRAEYEESGGDPDDLAERLVVRDATNAMVTTIKLYFGGYVFAASS